MARGDGPGAGSSSAGVGLPIGVERTLARATRDAEFRADLRERRGAAAEAAGIELSAAERAVLEAIDDQQLDQMIDHLADRIVEVPTPVVVAPPAGIRPGPPVAGGIRPGPIVAQGIRPEAVAGIREDVPSRGFHGSLADPTRGTRPGPGMVKGIRPGLPIALAAGAVVVGGACATLCMTAGSRPDEPPPPEPTEPQVPQSEGQTGDPPDGGTPDGGDGGVTPKTD